MIASIYQGLKTAETRYLTAISIDKLSIEFYEKQIFSSDFHSIRVYMFGLSFLTTLNLYKDYFKGCQMLRECEAKLCSCKLWPLPLFIFLLKKLLCLYTVRFCNQGVSWSSSCWWIEELCSQHLPQVVSKSCTRIRASNWLVTYWEPCIENERLSLQNKFNWILR